MVNLLHLTAGDSIHGLAILLDVAVKGLAVLAVAAAITLVLRRRSAALRHLVWALSVLGLLCIPVLSATLPAWRVPLLPSWATVPAPVPHVPPAPPATPAAVQTPAVVPPPVAVLPSDPQPQPGPLPQEDFASGVTPPIKAEPPATVAGASAVVSPVPQPSSPLWPTWTLLGWVAGLLVMTVPLLIGTVGIRLARRRAMAVTDPEWLSLLVRLRRQLGVARPVVLLRSSQSIIPLTFGLRRPVILLPREADTWTPEGRTMVLLHELAHIRRGDCLTQLLARLARVLYWFNPLVWLAGRMLRIERERACDDLVLAAGHKPSGYAAHLLEIVRSLQAMRCPSLAAVAMAKKSQFEGRLLAILDGRVRRGRLTRLAILAVTLLVAGVVIPMACMRPTTADGPVTQRQAEGKPATQSATTQPAWGETAEGLRIGLSVDKATYRPGDDITFTVSLVNDSNRKLACVLPSSDANSDFPFLIEFRAKRVVHQPEQDVASWGGLSPKTTKVLRTPNPGANEYKLVPKGQVFSAGFDFNTAAIVSGTFPGEFGDYEVRVEYFIRGSTPVYGPAHDEKLQGAELWAGRYLYSGPVKFTVLADLPGGGLSIAQAVGGEGFGMAVAGKGNIPGENSRGQWSNGGFKVSQPLSKAARAGESLDVGYSVGRTERPIFKDEPVILILHGFDKEYGHIKVIKAVADTVENRAAVAKAVADLKDDGAWREATMARYQEQERLREPIKMSAQTQPERSPAAKPDWTLQSMPEIVIGKGQLYNGFGFINLDKAEAVARPASAPVDFKQREGVTAQAYTSEDEWVLGSDPKGAVGGAPGGKERTFTAREVTADWWDKATPSQVLAQINGPLLLEHMESTAGTPRVYLFRTIAGTRGLARLVAPADSRDEFHVTIKRLVKDGEEAPATQPAAQPAAEWGPAFRGVRVRLRPQFEKGKDGDDPPVLFVDIRNQGEWDIQLPYCKFEAEVLMDGIWYRWGGPYNIISSTSGPHARTRENIEIPLGACWTRVKEPGTKQEFFAIAPGRHMFRVRFMGGMLASNTLTVDVPVSVAQPATQSGPAKVFHSPAEILAGLPPDARPDPLKGWDEFSKPKADKWLDDNVTGRGFEVVLGAVVKEVKLKPVHPEDRPNDTIRWDVELTLERIPFGYDEGQFALKLDSLTPFDPTAKLVSLHLGAATVTASGDEDFARRAKTLQAGDTVTVRGTIRKAAVWEATWEKGPPELWILLENQAVDFPAGGVSASGPAEVGEHQAEGPGISLSP